MHFDHLVEGEKLKEQNAKTFKIYLHSFLLYLYIYTAQMFEIVYFW